MNPSGTERGPEMMLKNKVGRAAPGLRSRTPRLHHPRGAERSKGGFDHHRGALVDTVDRSRGEGQMEFVVRRSVMLAP
jgi:hypothetical protein